MEEQKRSKLPPTEKQLLRIGEFIEHEAIAPHLDTVLKNFDSKIKSRGGAGIMLNWMRKEIEAWNAAHR
jgi:hypothetical protein